MNELRLADLGEGMHEAEVVEWLAQVGDLVSLDQPLVRVETDKAIVEIPSPVAGRLREIRFQPGQSARVGEVLAVYEAAASESDSPVLVAPAPASAASAAASSASNGQTAHIGRVLAAPYVRKLAFERGVDLARVPASGPHGRVTLEDLKAFFAQMESPQQTGPGSQQTDPGPQRQPGVSTDQRVPLTGLRKRIAEHMERSWRTIPHASAFDELDASALVALRRELLPVAEKRGLRLTYLPLLVRLLLPLLREFPIFNASLDEERREIIYKRSYHLGIATSTPEGLIVPVLRDADRLNLGQIAERLEQLGERARTRTLALDEARGSTFTLNNIGSFGGSSGTPIINFPEAAILAVGRIEEKPVARSGALLIQPRMPLTLSFDHRLIDGAQAGAFLARFKDLVEQPQQLWLDML